jgi:hypothetical protein
LTRASYNFNFGPAFVQQRSRFQCALTASDHEYLFSRKLSKLAMFGRV